MLRHYIFVIIKKPKRTYRDTSKINIFADATSPPADMKRGVQYGVGEALTR